MGASLFMVTGKGKNAKEAFNNAISNECSNSGYSGSIAEKSDFVMIDCPPNNNPVDYADELIEEGDNRIDDKWGPAGCIKMSTDTWLFFGYASS